MKGRALLTINLKDIKMSRSDKENRDISNGLSCPLPILDYDTVQLAHGAGGRLMADLINNVFVKIFDNDILSQMEDQATLKTIDAEIVFTTDSFVVDPIFFPGGNIGDLAVNGTVNDLCMNGGQPMYLSAGFIIEEGLMIADLITIVMSMRESANKAGIKIVTGDTKVVNKGSCDKIFINTSGVGCARKNISISASNLKVGDQIIISGTIADHGMAIMTSRKGLSFVNNIISDTSQLSSLVNLMLNTTSQIHAMRDPTRGGVAATLDEFAKKSDVGIKLNNNKIPIKDEVNAACEILGIDPLFVANEGKLIAVVSPEIAEKLVEVMRTHEFGRDAQIIGEVVHDHPGIVTKKTILGVEQIIDLPFGEQLPRIC